MHITRLELRDIPPLGNIDFDCHKRVNLFIGPNASGKSTILRGLKHLHSMRRNPVEVDENKHVYSHVFSVSRPFEDEYRKFSFETLYDRAQGTSNPTAVIWDAVPFLYIPPTRVNLPPQDVFYETITRPEPYGFNATLFDFCNSVGDFNGESVEDAIDWARKKMTRNLSQQNQLKRALELGYRCARAICLEVIYDESPHTYVEVRDEEEQEEYEEIYPSGDGFYPTGRIPHYAMGIVTNDDPLGEPLYAGALSSGTQGTLLWIWALALKIANHYGWAEGWEGKPAILLIDEIENHLHPTWQRRVIPALLEHFPGLQIFAATHSPFVVAGLKAGQVHLLKRNKNGRVIARTNTEDVVGWTADEILRTMMGVEDPTDAETAAAAHDLRQLRNEAPKSDPAEEERRQERMQKLRQLVDRDLLAGGPMAAQRDLFEEQFAEALKKYQQSQGLNQENG